MDIDPKDLIENAKSATEGAKEKSEARLNAAVAITVAVLATFLGICKVKDDNIVQGMQQAQADKLDYWAFYQARHIRHDLAESVATQLELARRDAPPASAATYDEAIARYRTTVADQAKKKEALREKAEAAQIAYDQLNYRDDQFDISDALLAIAIALMAVTALTRLWALYFVALVPTAFGVLMGLAGFLGWQMRPDFLIRLLA